MSEELRPCPFCGSEQPQDSKDDGNVPYEFGMSRSCKFCSAAVNLGWNTRPIEDELRARIAKLRKALIRIKEEYYSNGTWEETADDMYELANDALLNDKESIVNG